MDKKECPDGKEINPKTGRCVKICEAGKIRDPETGKCIKNVKNVKNDKPIKVCPEGKILNPITNRCIKIKTKKDTKQPKKDTKQPKKDTKQPKSKDSIKSKDSGFNLYYPDLNDDDFQEKLSVNKNFLIHKIPTIPTINNIKDFNDVANRMCGNFETALYQHFVSQYISYKTPYKSILLYHGVGVGKTCSAITMSESLLISHNNSEPVVWVIMPQSLKQSFKSQIFDIDTHTFENITNQCTGDIYLKLLNIYKSSFNNKKVLNTEIKKYLKNRYRVFTYDGFAKFVNENYNNKIVQDKVIIIDEAHNIRSTNKKDKDSFLALFNILKNGVNNRLVLLSATPMYNEPRDILDLFKLMLLNDGREDILNKYQKIFNTNKLVVDDNVIKLVKMLSSTYISYLRGKNPFTFALKLNPENSGIDILKKIPLKDPSNKLIPEKEKEWLNNIDNGVVTSKMSISQKNIVEKMGYNKQIKDDVIEDGENIDETSSEEDKINKNMNLLQPMNIVYDVETGSRGFFSFFTKVRDTDPLYLKYNNNYENALFPDENNLGKYSGKFLKICNIIRKSKGIVVIYSRFVYSGILPFAVCLEHMGFTREGTNNIINNPKIIDNKPTYENIKSPKYCILTSDNKEIMGTTNIDTLINKINRPENLNGELIKVILITPVASEGLSFYNAREIHLIEPWYHFNRPEQIIGRGIRNCRHQNLPLEERNTTVYIHATEDDNDNRETIDINALRISTRKYIDSMKVDKIIRDNALDCVLMKNINYFPKSMFKMGRIKLLTSQNKEYLYDFGDKEEYNPRCKNTGNTGNTGNGYNSESYKHLLKRTQNSLRNIIQNNIKLNNYYIEYIDIINDINVDEELIVYTLNKSIYPYEIINNYYIIMHKNGIKIISNKKDKYNKLNILFQDDEANNIKNAETQNNINIDNIIKKINIDLNDKNATTISLYNALNNEDFQELIKYILKSEYDNPQISYIAECLYYQGVLIKGREIPSFNKNDNLYIGYVNIYDLNNKENSIDKLDINLHIKGSNNFNIDVSKKEREEFAKYRKKIQSIPEDMTLEDTPWGIIEPTKSKSIIINKFKIFSTDPVVGKGKKTGRVCDTYSKESEHIKFYNQINKTNIDKNNFKNKKVFCNYICNKLMDINKLILLPLYKPV